MGHAKSDAKTHRFLFTLKNQLFLTQITINNVSLIKAKLVFAGFSFKKVGNVLTGGFRNVVESFLCEKCLVACYDYVWH